MERRKLCLLFKVLRLLPALSRSVGVSFAYDLGDVCLRGCKNQVCQWEAKADCIFLAIPHPALPGAKSSDSGLWAMAEDALYLGAAAPSTTALFPCAEGARFCLQLPETLQPINSDLAKT